MEYGKHNSKERNMEKMKKDCFGEMCGEKHSKKKKMMEED